MSCRAALATLDLLEAGMMANATARGEELLAGLRRLQGAYPESLREARGLGLMLAIDVIAQGNPAPELRDAIVQEAFERGLLLLGCGESAVRFCPPLCISSAQVRNGARRARNLDTRTAWGGLIVLRNDAASARVPRTLRGVSRMETKPLRGPRRSRPVSSPRRDRLTPTPGR